MTEAPSGKGDAILKALALLRRELGEGAFRVVEEQEASAHSVSLVSPKHEGLLAYVSAFDKPEGFYFLSLEYPPPEGSARSYAPAGEFEHVNLGRLVRLIKQHLKKGPGRWEEEPQPAPQPAPVKPGGRADS